jgi:hypothetical protein
LIRGVDTFHVFIGWARSCRPRRGPSRGFFETGKLNIARCGESILPVKDPLSVEFVTSAMALAQDLASGSSLKIDLLHEEKCVPSLDPLRLSSGYFIVVDSSGVHKFECILVKRSPPLAVGILLNARHAAAA